MDDRADAPAPYAWSGAHTRRLDAAEAARLAALRATGLLDGPPEPNFDRITRLVGRLLGVRLALVTLVDADRQYFKSHCGLAEPWSSTRETPLSHSFCRHVVATGSPLAVPDARQHPTFRTSPAIAELGVVAYLGVPLTTPQGHHLGALCACDDRPRAWTDDDRATLIDLAATVITEVERQAAWGRAHENERWFRAIFDRTFQLMGLLTPDGILLEANRTALEFIGAHRDAVVGRPFAETPWWSGSPESKARIEQAIRAAAAGDFVRFETEHSGADGRTMAVDFSLTPVRDAPDGPVVLLIPEGRDITERKRAETALRDREELLQLATEVAGLGIWDWDLASGRLAWSAELDRIAGLPSGGFGGTFAALEALVHPDDRDAVMAAYRQALTDRAGFRSEHRFVLADGSVRWIDTRGRALFSDATGVATRMIGVCLDVTERRGHEQQEHDRAEALADADRRKDEFLAMLGHELRNPLAPITHAVEMLELSDADPGLRRRMRGLIDQQVRILTQLVDDLLEMSRINRGKIRLRLARVDLAEVVWRGVAATDALIRERGHRLTLDLPPRPVPLLADPLRLEQVLVNLLTNAAKYTEPGGRIGVSAAVAPDGQSVALRVTDTGMGIEAAMLPRLFDLFIQSERSLDRAEGGLGIGLTLVQRLVEMHGGSVEARSAGPGQGSEFLVRLPIAADLPAGPEPTGPPPPAVVPPPTPATPAEPKRALRVMVVDDNRPAAESLLLILGRWGHVASACHDGAEALDAIAGFEPDVVLLDIGLPGLDGYAVARAVRDRCGPRSPLLVAVTGYGADTDLERATQAGIDHHFLKPIDLAALRRLLDEHHPVAAQPAPVRTDATPAGATPA